MRHLAPDARRAGFELPEVRLDGVSPPQLRALLEALAELAPKVEYPATPEMRITGGEQQFLVLVREGHMRFSSWSVRAGGDDLSPAQMLTTITGIDAAAPAAAAAVAVVVGSSRGRRVWLGVLLVAGILGSNVFTAWWLLAPPPDLPPELRPPYRVLEPEPGKRLLLRVAGTYETGQAEGDHRLIVRPDGTAQWATFGAGRVVAEEVPLTVTGGETESKPVLVTGERFLIEVRDALTIVYFGDTYKRVQP